MPFNIELSKKDTSIKIQVLKNSITIYFNDNSKDRAYKIRENWSHLDGHFMDDFPGMGSKNDIYLTVGVFHRKKEHTNTRESTIAHTHIPFKVEVTPELFSLYLNQFYQQQCDHSEKKYQFFEDRDEVENMIAVFTEYYKNYKGSTLEAEYDRDTELTDEEKKEHKEDVRKAKEEEQEQLSQREQARKKRPDLLANLLLLSVLSKLERENSVNNNLGADYEANLDMRNDEICPIM